MGETAPQTPGLYEPYYRPGDVVGQVNGARSAFNEYSNLNSVYVVTFEFKTNSYESSDKNPLEFGCNNDWVESKARNAWINFAGLKIRSDDRNCFGSGQTSTVRQSVSLYLYAGSYQLLISKDDTGRTHPEQIAITRDDLFTLKSTGSLTKNLDYNRSAYSITLRSR